jgi:hypothetical protein
VHNLSHFDGIFLLNILSNLNNTHLDPTIKDGKIINLELSSIDCKLNFRDSLLMLPNSLKKLAIAFKVENKGLFPYSFANTVELNYIGKVPSMEMFNDITLEEYNLYIENFKNNLWSLRTETIKYCELDCIILYKIIEIFNSLIFEKFDLNIHKFPTLPSLAFAIYRCKYLNDFKIPKLVGQIFNDIRMSYTGGATDMYKPYGNNIYRYDVNSLYPYIMKSTPMPIGNIKFFEGDILKFEPDAFGFFEVEVTAPDNLNEPIIQTKVETSQGLRTVAPLGTWTTVLFSEELYNAMKYGYKFKVYRGYLFDKGYIFTDYVNDLYSIKQSHKKDHPMYLISKLLLNSLYGRFGMADALSNHKIITNNELFSMIDNYTIDDVIQLENNKSLVSFKDETKLKEIFINNYSSDNANISIGIASAITSGARIFMSQFKNNPEFTLYYSDTDSIDINKPLDSKFIGPELGKMKLEYVFKEATFLAPKVYGGIDINNTEVCKVKGLKNVVKYSDLKTLLNLNTELKIEQNKWFKNITESNITIKNQLYTLIPTENKRKLIYSNNKLTNTVPFRIDNNRTIKINQESQLYKSMQFKTSWFSPMLYLISYYRPSAVINKILTDFVRL